MKLKKILAAVAAAAVAVSTMAINALAIEKGTYIAEDGGNTFLYLVADDGKPQWAVDNSLDVTEVYGIIWHATFDADEVANDSAWIGGGLGANSNSTGWKQVEWGRNEKEIIADLENGTVTWKNSEPIFKADDKYVHLWITAWGGKVTFDSAELLDADGNVIAASANAAPAETEAPAETAAEETTEAAPEETEAAPVETEAEVEDEDVDVDADEPEEEAEEPEEEVAPVETEAPAVEEAPAPETNTAPAQTGNVAVASIVAVMAVAGAATIVAKKRK